MRRIRYWYRRRLMWIPRIVKQVIVVVIGGTIVLIGLVMIVTPGPAIVVIPIGLAVLAVEFAWARRWLKRLRSSAGQAKRHMGGMYGPARVGEHSSMARNIALVTAILLVFLAAVLLSMWPASCAAT